MAVVLVIVIGIVVMVLAEVVVSGGANNIFPGSNSGS